MFKLIALLTLISSLSAFAQSNLSDSLDENSVPAAEESREGELIDSRDSIDLNETPAEFEQREEDESIDPQMMESGKELESEEGDM